MNVGDVITRAINEYYNNPGTSNDALTPVMVAHWIEKSLLKYWAKFSDNNFGYYSSRENVLNVNSSSNIYPLPNGNSSVTTINFSGIPTSGSFVINYQFSNGNSASITVTYNEVASAIQTAINGSISPNQSTVTGGPPGSSISIAWNTWLTNFSITSSGTLQDANGKQVRVTPVTSNLNVAYVTAMASRTGSPPNYNYSPLGTFFPNAKYGYGLNLNTGLQAILTNGSQGNTLAWCFEAGSPDPVTQQATQSIRLSGWPTQSITLVYDCIRYPNRIMFDSSVPAQPITTQELDLPLHLHDGVVNDVLIQAYRRMKADESDLKMDAKEFDAIHAPIENRSLQRQGPEIIQVTDDAWGNF